MLSKSEKRLCLHCGQYHCIHCGGQVEPELSSRQLKALKWRKKLWRKRFKKPYIKKYPHWDHLIRMIYLELWRQEK